MTFRHSMLAVFIALFITGSASTVWADNCGTNDRDPLPNCTVSYRNAKSYGVTNNCDYTITVKADIKNGTDHRFDLNNGEHRSHSIPGIHYNLGGRRVRGLHCCPRYNRCS